MAVPNEHQIMMELQVVKSWEEKVRAARDLGVRAKDNLRLRYLN